MLGFLLLASIFHLIQKNENQQSIPDRVDLQIPQFTLPIFHLNDGRNLVPNVDQQSFSSVDLQGKIALVHFWASWCEICTAEKPVLKRLYRDYGQDVLFVGIVTNDTYSELIRTHKVDSLPYTQLLDEEGKVARSFQIGSLPETFLVSQKGAIIKRYSGALSLISIQEIEKLLQSKE
jgi:thiol-disulfide isomerase/thioredoxin